MLSAVITQSKRLSAFPECQFSVWLYLCLCNPFSQAIVIFEQEPMQFLVLFCCQELNMTASGGHFLAVIAFLCHSVCFSVLITVINPNILPYSFPLNLSFHTQPTYYCSATHPGKANPKPKPNTNEGQWTHHQMSSHAGGAVQECTLHSRRCEHGPPAKVRRTTTHKFLFIICSFTAERYWLISLVAAHCH